MPDYKVLKVIDPETVAKENPCPEEFLRFTKWFYSHRPSYRADPENLITSLKGHTDRGKSWLGWLENHGFIEAKPGGLPEGVVTLDYSPTTRRYLIRVNGTAVAYITKEGLELLPYSLNSYIPTDGKLRFLRFSYGQDLEEGGDDE